MHKFTIICSLILLHKSSENDKIGANIYLITKEKNVWKKNMH